MITKDTKLKEIYDYPIFSSVKDLIVSGDGNYLNGELKDLTLYELSKEKNPSWYYDDMVYGLNHLEELLSKNKNIVYKLPSGGSLIYFEEKEKKSNKTLILLSGGAYGAVCNLDEAFPVATKLNKLGYSCFVLSYRTARGEDFSKGIGLFPKPLEDVKEALTFIKNGNFPVNTDDYTLIGFSAGGHVASLWGEEKVGYKKYDMIKPSSLVLVYPLLSLCDIPQDIKQFFMAGLFGKDGNDDRMKEYSPLYNVDKDYPKTFITQAENDVTIDINITKKFISSLKSVGVRSDGFFVKTGSHGFGLGSNSDASSWVERAISFMEE